MISSGWFSPSFPLSNDTGRKRWKSFELLQDIGKHDICTLTFESYTPDFSDTLGPGTPAVVEYWTANRRSKFIGTIVKQNPSKKFGSMYEHSLVCAAPSRQFRDTAVNVWKNKTAPEVIQDLGKRLGFKVVTKQHPLRKSSFTQIGGSYWEFMVGLANLCGYAIRVEGTIIYFLPIPDIVNLFKSVSPHISYTGAKGTSRLSSFTTSIGNTSDDQYDSADSATVTAFGPDDKNFSDITSSTGSAVSGQKRYLPTYEKSNPTTIAYTREEAKALSQGMADRGMLAYNAHLSCSGEPGLVPYHPVYVTTESKVTTGWWVVKGVRHTIDSTRNYLCEATVSSDEVSQRAAVPPSFVPLRDISIESLVGPPGNSILVPSGASHVVGRTYTPDSRLAVWANSSPGTTLSPNYGVLA